MWSEFWSQKTPEFQVSRVPAVLAIQIVSTVPTVLFLAIVSRVLTVSVSAV